MIYILSVLCFFWNNRYKIIGTLGGIVTVVSVVVTLGNDNYYEAIMKLSVGIVTVITVIELERQKQNRGKYRNRHR